jgi:uncharacterized protein DUF4012
MVTASAPDPPTALRRWTKPRGIRAVVIGALAVILLLTAIALVAALSARHALLHARQDLVSARSALIAGDPTGAERSFANAGEVFSSVKKGPVGFFLHSSAWVPLLGDNATTTLAISDAGVTTSHAGSVIATAVADTPGGLAALSPSGGKFDISRLGPLHDAAAQADVLLTQALGSIKASPASPLLGSVAAARTLMIQQLASLETEVKSGASILQGLPTFLGQDRPRSYLLAAQDPAEMRGTGGVIGAFTILTIDDGRFRFAPFRPIQTLPIPRLQDVPPPSAEYARNYNQFRGGGRFWLAINLTPDFPTAAQALLNAYKVAEGTSLDGVIFTDPFALQALLRIEGPTRIPDLGKSVTAASVIPFITNRAFSVFPDPAVRKRVLGSVATDVVNGFISGPPASFEDFRIIAKAAGEGHLLVFSTDKATEDGLRGTGAGGTLPTPPGDFLSVIENSAGANKVDFYQDRSVTYKVALGSGGTATATTDVQFTNHAPTHGQPGYVIGPHAGSSRVGESSQLVNVYAGPESELRSATLDGAPTTLGTGSELGDNFFQAFYRTASKQTSDLKVNSYIPAAWATHGSGGTYDLTFLGQTSVRPQTLRIEVVAPAGAHITSTSPDMQIQGATAIWSGTPTHNMAFSVTFDT